MNNYGGLIFCRFLGANVPPPIRATVENLANSQQGSSAELQKRKGEDLYLLWFPFLAILWQYQCRTSPSSQTGRSGDKTFRGEQLPLLIQTLKALIAPSHPLLSVHPHGDDQLSVAAFIGAPSLASGICRQGESSTALSVIYNMGS